ncbi:MAG TPA: ABC transporter permease [Bacteroidia bacterium]|nr:ABC transporter permease [Bacteroidia bacterium]
MFMLGVYAPGDPVETILARQQGESGLSVRNIADEAAYMSVRHKLGLDLPLFYFSITNSTSSDTLYRIPKADVRESMAHIAFINGSWPNVARYYSALKQFESELNYLRTDSLCQEDIIAAKKNVNELYVNYDQSKIASIFSNLTSILNGKCKVLQPLSSKFVALKNTELFIVDHQSSYAKFIPAIHWYGFRNQYHHWLVNFLRGNFGFSYQDMRPVSSIIWDAMKWTLGISFASVMLAYFIAIPLGVKAATTKGSKKERATTTGLFMLYSLPNFWIATILIIFFCGGDWFSWFPAPGAAPIPADAPFQYHITQGIYRLILPLICWTYTSLAFISRQMRGGMLNTLGQDYIRTARAKGLPEERVVWKHALRNSLLPVITLFANVFPLLLSGSVVIEEIFSIPGMGQVSYNALIANDYPVVFANTMFAALLTLGGTLIADILYAVADPRISYSKTIA